MITSAWVMRASSEAKARVEKWLQEESVRNYVLTSNPDVVEIGFSNIEDAFRFRLHFDEELVQSAS